MIPISSGYKWLVQFGGKKCNFNIFQSSGISWVCSTLVNEEQHFSVVAPIWRSNCTRNSSKVAEVIHELEFAMYLVERSFTLLKQWGLLYLPITSKGNFCAISNAT